MILTRLARPLASFGLACLLFPTTLLAQTPSFEDASARSAELERLYRGKVSGTRLEPNWIDGGKAMWYQFDTGQGTHRFRLAKVDGNAPADLFDHDAMADALGEMLDRDVQPDRLPLVNLTVETDVSGFTFRVEQSRFRATLGDEITLEKLDKADAQQGNPAGDRPERRQRGGNNSNNEHASPDGNHIVVLRDHNVFLRPKDGDATQLTFDGTPQDAYRPPVYWSPDSEKFVVMQHKDGFEREVTIVQSSPPDQLQPKLVTYDYRKAGDDIPQDRPRLFHANGEQIELDESLWPNPWSNNRVRWRSDSKAFTFLYNQRGHQVMRVISVDAESGEAEAVVEEKTDTHLGWADKSWLHFIDDDRLIWMSERSGWNHLYLYDQTTDDEPTLTSGDWAVKKVFASNNDAGLLWLETYGRPGEDDSLYTHFAKVDFDGNLVWLTEPGSNHERPQFSPDWSHYIDTHSRVDQPQVHELRRSSDGAMVMKLEEADASRLYDTGWQPPIRFTANGRDEDVKVHGVIVRPSDFDESKSYPVIENIYMGLPIVPKSFRPWDGMRGLAELGFVVVVNDPMVTVWPSRRHWDTGYQNLGDGGFPDRIAWIKAAGEAHDWMDLDRVGIYGTSAGGQASLRGMLAHGDFYKACVSSCGCHDNRMDKIWWNEYWMGWPVGPHYAEQSNVTNAHKLQGKLMLINGEIDQNVDPASTMQVVDALIKADKDFDLIMLPNAGHTGGGAYGERRRRQFFYEHLIDNPPTDQTE